MKNRYVIVRTYSAGVFAGELVSRKGKEVVIKNARRLWYWTGAQLIRALDDRATTVTISPADQYGLTFSSCVALAGR